MKIIYLSLLLLFIGTNVTGQVLDCSHMKIGMFEFISKTRGKSVIERTETTQTETTGSTGVKSVYDIFWTSDCTYEMRNRRLISGETPYVMKPEDVITMQIIKIDGMKMTVRITSNFMDKNAEVEITKVRD